jgi:hypothetical protein
MPNTPVSAALLLGTLSSALAAQTSAPVASSVRAASANAVRQSSLTVSGVIEVETLPQLRRDEDAERTNSVSDDKSSDYEKWSMIGTCASAGIAIVQAAFFFWQLKLMRRSAEDSAEAARAARDSADIARDTFTKLERPWIFLDGIRMTWRSGPDEPGPRVPNNFWLSMKFKNSGRTPARISSLNFAFLKTAELPEIPDYTRCVSSLIVPASVAADGEFETNQVGPAPGEDVQHTIFGRLTYTDMVGMEHHTGFAIDMSQWMPASSTNPNRAYDFHD